MTLEEFQKTIANNTPPENISELLTALWYDAKGDWTKSHKITQDIEGKDAAWVHAYLHRKEGDSGNASYWYSIAGKKFSDKSLEEEWKEIVKELLARSK